MSQLMQAVELEEQMVERLFWIANFAVMAAIVVFGGVALTYAAF